MEGSSDAGSIPAISTKRKRPIGAFFFWRKGGERTLGLRRKENSPVDCF